MSEPRLDPENEEQGTDSAWWSVHAARYRFAMEFVRGKRVLDVACGSGYGMTMMLESASGVIGVDVDAAAALKASRANENDRALVILADGCELPFANRSFDVVTSFETLEHLHKRSEFLAELRRVLKSNGICLLSTPNAHYTKPVNGTPHNPFHVHEYTPNELHRDLCQHFGELEMLGQSLSPRFLVSPFWEDQERMPKTPRMALRRLIWRVLYRMPRPAADGASRLLWGHRFLPQPDDFVFDRAMLNDAPVIMTMCRRPA